MSDESMNRDATLGDALVDVVPDAMNECASWTELRRGINARAASELMRRRQRRRRARIFIPAGVAAGFALFVLLTRAPHQTDVTTANPSVEPALSIDELLDANLSDGQFRALVSGASETNDLLTIAAQDDRP